MSKGKTYYEDGRYYAVITLPNGHEYYSGAFNSRSSAYRYSVEQNARHRWASKNGFIYNVNI